MIIIRMAALPYSLRTIWVICASSISYLCIPYIIHTINASLCYLCMYHSWCTLFIGVTCDDVVAGFNDFVNNSQIDWSYGAGQKRDANKNKYARAEIKHCYSYKYHRDASFLQ